MKNRKQILVIDDESFLRRLLNYVFEREGFIVHVADNGYDGLELARKIKPDLIFTDLDMPRKDGFQVCREIRKDEALKDVYIIILTGRGKLKDAEKGVACGANEYIVKPFHPEKVIRRVKEILNSRVKESVPSA